MKCLLPMLSLLALAMFHLIPSTMETNLGADQLAAFEGGEVTAIKKCNASDEESKNCAQHPDVTTVCASTYMEAKAAAGQTKDLRMEDADVCLQNGCVNLVVKVKQDARCLKQGGAIFDPFDP